MAAGKRMLYRKNDVLDVIDITKSAFEVFIVLIIALFAAAASCAFFFRVITVELPDGDGRAEYSFVSLRNTGSISKGDIVSIDDGSDASAGEVLAFEGEAFDSGDDIIVSSALSEMLDDGKIPEGYVLINRDIKHSRGSITAELAKKNNVTGKAVLVIYPFKYFGREADYIVKK